MRPMLAVIILITFAFHASLHADTGRGDAQALVQLPHPVPAVMEDKVRLGVTEAQAQAIRERIIGVYPGQIGSRMQRAAELEREIRQAVLQDNRTRVQLKVQLDELAAVQREVTDIQIDALNTLADILTEEQMQQTLARLEQQAESPAGPAKIEKFRVDELALLPHPGKLFKQGSIQLTPEQQQRLVEDVKAVYPPLFHPKMQQAFELQRRLQRAVAEGKSKEEVRELLDEMASIKRAAMDPRIDALNELRAILTPEQWDAVNRLSYQ